MLRLTCDVAPPGVPDGGDTRLAVRQTALEFVEVVLKGGACAPWKAIPSLVAAVTDPCDKIASKCVVMLAAVG